MNNQSNSTASPQYASVLASLSLENGNCVNRSNSVLPNSLQAGEIFSAEFVGMDELTIMPSNEQVSRFPSRVGLLAGGFNDLSGSKSIEIDADELLQSNNPLGEQHISIKPTAHSAILQKKENKCREMQQPESHLLQKKRGNFIIPEVDDTKIPHTVTHLADSDLNHILNLSVNKLPLQSTNNTAVEQPSIGPCSCFICGYILNDPEERYSYPNTQKLFSMKIPILKLLSDILHQTVMTNTDSIDLCPNCSELMSEIDITYKHMNTLKEQITKLFSGNKRPKLTFHILPKPSSLVPKNHSTKKSKDVNLAELAFTRPRRGRVSKMKTSLNDKKFTEMLEREKPTKKKGGRPRKPFQCHVCRRKFFTQSMNDKHLLQEHNITSNNLVSGDYSSVNSATPDIHKKPENATSFSKTKVKEESTEDRIIGDCIGNENTPNFNSFLQKTSMPSSPKTSVLESTNAALQPTVRPIQPKPQTLVQTAEDGSLMFYMNPTLTKDTPTLIKVSPGYLNLKSESYTCDICQRTFLDDKGFKMHKIAAHGVRKRKFDYGTKNDTTNEDKNDEIQKLWACNICKISFSSRKFLLDHKRISHENNSRLVVPKDARGEKMYSCDECDQIFNYKYKMERHKESHLPFNQVGPHEFMCCLCGLKVASKAALKIHLHRFHSKDEDTKDFLCAECGYMTGTKKAFTDHLRVHNDNPGQKKVCHICRKEMLPSSYKIHMIRMHGEAKYPCDTCGQRFTVRSDLMKHLNTIHSSLRPYDCGLCGEKFVTSEALRYHKNKVHSTVFHFCEVCGKRYKWKGELRTHINRCHNESRTRYQCNLCSRSYADRRKLCHHMASKHNIKQVGYDRGNSAEKDRIKINGEMVQSGYEPQGSLITSTQPIMTSITCSSTEAEIHLVAPDENINTLHGYENGDQSTTLTTLHSPVSGLQCSYSQPNSITQYNHPQIQVSTSYVIPPVYKS